jgi:nifR3 family TIM-barrel protein
MKKLKINNLEFDNPLFLAPMVDVTDLPYRLICRRSGCSMAYTEMLQVEALNLAKNNKSLKLKTLTNKNDKPLGIQITGRRISDFGKIIPELRKYDLVDLNCGCPGSLTIDHGSGSYLMKSPPKIYKIIKLLKDNGLTVTAKIRLGFNRNNVLELAEKIDSAGADALTLHPRLASQGRGIPADWSWFSKVKEKIGIPLIGNGDVFKPEDAKKILEVCDGVMIARGAIGNPLIFNQTLNYIRTGKYDENNYNENLKLYREYLKLAKKYDLLKMSKVKYIGGKFLRGFEGAPQIRNDFMNLRSFDEVEGFVGGIV